MKEMNHFKTLILPFRELVLEKKNTNAIIGN